MDERPRLAFWFRYGPAEHAELHHAIPRLIERLAANLDVHYFGMKSRKDIPRAIAQHATIHHLPLTVRRSSLFDKTAKTLLWYLCLPLVGVYCRCLRVRVVFIDETLPLAAWLARVFFGRRVAMTVADFFVDVYMERPAALRPLRSLIKRIDYASWRKLDLVFTKTGHTIEFLAARGVPRRVMRSVYDPCDAALYHPLDTADCKRRMGYADDEVVLVHHGILHPNKGNDRVLRVLAELRSRVPSLRYLLVGSGPDASRLKALASELGLADVVRFTGWLPSPRDVNVALNAGDIGLVMRVGQEADHFHVTGTLVHNMACGLPVLAARLKGIREVVAEEDAGLLFDPQDAGELARKLVRLCTDGALRRRMGERARRLALELFDVDRITEQIAAPLLDVALERPPPA